MIKYVSSDFYLFIYILAVFVIFLINLSINYYWYKTPKWLPLNIPLAERLYHSDHQNPSFSINNAFA